MVKLKCVILGKATYNKTHKDIAARHLYKVIIARWEPYIYKWNELQSN